MAGAWRKSSWSKRGVHGGLPLGTSCVCSGAECGFRAGCSVCSTEHENLSVSYTRASQRQLGATLSKGHRIKCNPALGQERIALEQSWQGCLWLSDLWRFPQLTMNSWFTSHSAEAAPCFHPKELFCHLIHQSLGTTVGVIWRTPALLAPSCWLWGCADHTS